MTQRYELKRLGPQGPFEIVDHALKMTLKFPSLDSEMEAGYFCPISQWDVLRLLVACANSGDMVMQAIDLMRPPR